MQSFEWMNPNNMTGHPNQQTRPSVFFEAYPSPGTSSFDGGTRFPESGAITLPAGTFGSSTPSSFSHYQQGSHQFSQGFQLSSPQYPLGAFQFNSLPQSNCQTVQFPFSEEVNEFGSQAIHRPLRCKRKTDSPPLQPTKQHITEEKMTEHMSRLHISSETVTKPKETEEDKLQRLYMCEEMRKLQTESILPLSLLEKLNKPCTALVLWTPPVRLLPDNQEHQENDNNNNSGEQVPDNNLVANEVNMDFEL